MKKIFHISFVYWFIFICLTYFLSTTFAQEEHVVKKQFDLFWENMEKELSNSKWLVSSEMYVPIEEQSFKILLNVAPQLILPLILEKSYAEPIGNSTDILTNGYKHHHISYVLALLTNSVCKTDGWPHFDPWCGEPLFVTWYGGDEFSKERFNLLYSLLLKAREEKNEEKISMIHEAYRSQGIFMLSFLMEKIIEGDNDLLPIVQKMFDKYGDEIKGKSKEDILAWWEVNKEKYKLPPKDKEKFCYVPSYFINPLKVYTMEEKVNLLYHGWIGWEGRHLVQGTAPSQRATSHKSIELAKLIGYENTPQFHFLVDLGVEALPYLFLKLKEEETRFTLPVIEKIMGQKLTEEEIEKQIREAENLLKKPEPLVFREWTSTNGKFSIEAKYLSSTKQQVTLEKANGTVITVDLSKLSEADRDYVKKQSVTETQTPKDEKLND